MTRGEYMNKLQEALKDYEDDFAADIMEDYKRHFDEAAKDGRSDESVCEELGNVEDFINDIPEEFRKKVRKNQESTDSFTEADFGPDNKDNVDEGPFKSFGKRSYVEEFTRLTEEAEKAFGKAGRAAANVANDMAGTMNTAFSKLGDIISKAVDEAKEQSRSYNTGNDIDLEEYANVESPLVFGEYSDVENVIINLIDANVEIRQGNSSVTSITLSRPLTKKEMMYYEVDQTQEKTLKISAGIRKGLNFNININAEPLTFYVNLPYYCGNLNLTTVSGKIMTASDLRVNNCKFMSTSGAIESDFALVAKSVVLETVSGRISGINRVVASEAKLKSVSGHIESELDSANFVISTVSGGIKIGCIRKGNGKIDTVSGAIKVKLLSDIGAAVNSNSMSGSLGIITDKKTEWEGGENVAMMGIFNKGTRKAEFGDAGLVLKTNSVSGTVRVYDFGKNE